MTDDDSPWKDVLERYFAAFTVFFFPASEVGFKGGGDARKD